MYPIDDAYAAHDLKFKNKLISTHTVYAAFMQHWIVYLQMS